MASPPPLPCPPGESPFRIKGIAYRGMLLLVEQRVAGGLGALCESFEDERLAAFVRQPFLAATRYDILPMLPLNAALAELLGRPLAHLSRDAAAAQARYDARNVYRSLVESRSLKDLASRLPRFGIQYYDFGGYSGRDEGPGHVVIRRTGLPRYIVPWYAPMQAAYMEEIVRQLGAKRAEAVARREAPTGSERGFDICTVDTDVKFST
jgi:hypothetical protein